MITRIRAGRQVVGEDVRPLYRALEPAVIFVTVGLAIAFQVLQPDSVSGSESRYVLPAVEAVALVVLIAMVELERVGAVKRSAARIVSITFILLAAGATAWTLIHVLDRLLGGQVHNGRALVFAGMKLWATVVIVYSLAYWELDRGGPGARNSDEPKGKHLWFPQDDPDVKERHWAPTFFDYLYVSLTNSTAFSPTDTMPLSHTAKLLMGSQSVLSLVTIGVVAARAVNIL